MSGSRGSGMSNWDWEPGLSDPGTWPSVTVMSGVSSDAWQVVRQVVVVHGLAQSKMRDEVDVTRDEWRSGPVRVRQIRRRMASPERRWQPWLLGAAVWTALGLLSVLQTSVYFMRDGRPVPWTPVFIDRMTDWYTCAIFTPVFFWLVRVVPWERGRRLRAAALQTLVVIACVPIKYFLYVAVIQAAIPDYRTVVFGRILVGSFISEVMAFGAMMAIVHAVEFNRRAVRHV